ncbi:MAG: hypothetical protein J6Q17_04525, partial [Clostridia bacterium]|nr:hypothetical protein [Clostridia bacterium]
PQIRKRQRAGNIIEQVFRKTNTVDFVIRKALPRRPKRITKARNPKKHPRAGIKKRNSFEFRFLHFMLSE